MTTRDEQTQPADEGPRSSEQLGLVERLRHAASELHKLDATLVDAPAGKSLYRYAADEIERLRSQLEQRSRGECICIRCGLRQLGVADPSEPEPSF